MDRLWSAWRAEYIRAPHGDDEACIFCRARDGADDEGFVLARAERAFALLNAYPYNPGHLMIAPLRHVAALENLQPDELAETGGLLQRAVRALTSVSSPEGFNVGMNLGRVAGAGVPGHLHWHVIPRWNGDTNFVTVVGETRVLPQWLRETYDELRPAFR